MIKSGSDPRLHEMFGVAELEDASIKPVVQLPRSGVSTPVLIGLGALFALMLFWILESRRTTLPEPTTTARSGDQEFTDAPPLFIPPAIEPRGVPVIPLVRVAPTVIQSPQTAREPRAMAGTPAPVVQYTPLPAPAPSAPPARTSSGAPMLVDGTAPQVPDAAETTAPGRDGAGLSSGGRIRSSELANRSTTVAQGTLIPAVLETALDSTRPGFARAIVSRDVKGFDGTQILIPRGSRLLGDYRSDTASGQKRAMISWTRLIRPDGVTIKLDSPVVDPVGRSGVQASVNTHFFQRFADALLQTTMDIGRTVASRSVSGSVVVALPGSIQGGQGGASFGSGNITPTLRVPAGKSVGVFVAHDLEFVPKETPR